MTTNVLFQDKDVRYLIFKFKKNILIEEKFNNKLKNIGIKLLNQQNYTGKKNEQHLKQTNIEIHNNSLLIADACDWRDTAIILGLYYLLK